MLLLNLLHFFNQHQRFIRALRHFPVLGLVAQRELKIDKLLVGRKQLLGLFFGQDREQVLWKVVWAVVPSHALLNLTLKPCRPGRFAPGWTPESGPPAILRR